MYTSESNDKWIAAVLESVCVGESVLVNDISEPWFLMSKELERDGRMKRWIYTFDYSSVWYTIEIPINGGQIYCYDDCGNNVKIKNIERFDDGKYIVCNLKSSEYLQQFNQKIC